MGKKIKLGLIMLFIAFTMQVKAQAYLTTLNKQATEMANAAAKGDYATLLKYTHPQIVKMMGGAKKAEEVLRQGIKAMTDKGLVFKKAGVGKVGQVIVSKENIQAIIPQIVDIEIVGQNIHSNNYLYCVSYDGGKNWYFLDTHSQTDVALRRMIPEINPKLVIPKSTTTYPKS